MRAARFLVTPELLRALLCLPLAAEIVGAQMDLDGFAIELTVTHPDLADVDLPEAVRPPLIRPTFQKQDPAVLLNWGQ